MSGGGVDWIAGAGGRLRGEARVPGDKSVSHRAIMLGAIADGVTHIDHFLEGEDTRATARAFAAMGVRIEAPAPGRRIVHGVGMRGLRAPGGDIDCGNAGTGMRLLAGLLAAQAFDTRLVGDASLSRRPMRRVTEPLRAMGACIDAEVGELPPLRIGGGAILHGIRYASPVASAQVKSCLLLAGLYAIGETTVVEPHPTRDHTERMLRTFGHDVRIDGNAVSVSPVASLRGTKIHVPGDVSSAAFPLVAATLVPGSDLLLREVGINPRRIGLLTALQAMGADISVLDAREHGGEPVADLHVRHASLSAIDLDPALVPDMIDELPILFVAAACAEGITRIRGAAELRVKESDRIAAMAAGLRALGIDVVEHDDGADIVGGRLSGGDIDSRGDHRIAMSFAVAAQRARGEVYIADCANVATSFPGFVGQARSWGMVLREVCA